jgi:hypothetical protein
MYSLDTFSGPNLSCADLPYLVLFSDGKWSLSGMATGHENKPRNSFFLDCLTLQYTTDILSRNVDNQRPSYAA